jgi:uncharacterized MAPEG superfamily protein
MHSLKNTGLYWGSNTTNAQKCVCVYIFYDILYVHIYLYNIPFILKSEYKEECLVYYIFVYF